MAPDKKRKSTGKANATTPTKKRKVETPKSAKTKPASKKMETPKKGKAATPKVTSAKVKKTETKSKTPAKASKTPSKTSAKAAKRPAKSTPAKASTVSKTPAKSAKTPVKTPTKATKKPEKKATKPVVKPKAQVKAKPVSTVTRTKLEKAKALKAKATVAKAKLKSTKALPKGKVVEAKKKESVEKPDKAEERKQTEKKQSAEKATAKAKAPVEKKRKADTKSAAEESPRKRRMITPNKKFADFELDVPAKRTITPNKKYADYETNSLPKSGKVSELRAFIQEKKSTKSEPDQTPKAAEKKKAAASTPASPAKAGKKETKESDISLEEKIKVFKPSEMKPAEKLLKKLQKKLEKEAKGAATPTPPENREKAKIKITKVVDYNKPMSSEDVEMKKLAKKVAAAKSKAKPVAVKPKPAPKTPVKANETAVEKVRVTPKVAKATPKPPPEKVVKPKKIKDMKREERPIQAKFLCQKKVQLAGDVQCWITGISVFPSGEIIMVDMSNRKIKLFSKEFEFLSKVALDAIPQDISVSAVDASCAYFTKPFSKEGIQKVNMSDGKLTLKEYFVTNGTNRGITCTKAGILTSVQDGRYHDVDINHFKIYLLDYTGNILQSVSTDTSGSRLFKLPLYFTVNGSGKQMIVADCIKQTSYILNVDMSGKIKFKYEGMNGNPITPRGLTIDEEDNIYVTEWERNNIYVLSPAGKRLQMLFSHYELQQDKIDGLIKPYQLCWYKHEDQKRLIVSQESCNTIKVFKLLTKAEMDAETAAAAANAASQKTAGTATEEKPAEGPKGKAVVPEVKVITVSKQAEKPSTTPTLVKTVVKPETKAEPVYVVKDAEKKVEELSEAEIPNATESVATVAETTQAQSDPQSTAKEEQSEAVPEASEVSQVVEQKEEIFAGTADDFQEEVEAADSEINGKLQDIVNAFPGESEAEVAAGLDSEVSKAVIADYDKPAQTEIPSNPETVVPEVIQQVVEQPAELVEQPQQTVMEQVVVVPEQVETTDSNIDALTQQSVLEENGGVVETVAVSEAPVSMDTDFTNYQTIVYDNAGQSGDINLADAEVVDTTVVSEGQVVTSENVFVSEYQNVVTDVPMELETVTTEYVV